MRHDTGTFKDDRSRSIFYQSWSPDSGPRGILVIVHGLAEHGGRYGNLVDHCVPRGYALYALDHPGHGKSEGRRVFLERFEEYTDTLKTFCRMIRSRQDEVPLFMVGHSMGGLIVSCYLIDHGEDLAGAVLSAPAVKMPDTVSPLTVFVSRVLSNLVPALGVMRLDATGISRDEAVVKAYEEDPLVYRGKITARLGLEMLQAMGRVEAEAEKIETPLLIMQGGADRLVSPEGATMLYERAGASDKTIRIYDGFYHELFNEPGRERVLLDLEVWLEEHSPGPVG